MKNLFLFFILLSLAHCAFPQLKEMRAGDMLFEKEQYQLAATHYQKALKKSPDHTQANVKLAQCLLESGKPDEAKKHIEKALSTARRPTYEMHATMGKVLQLEHQFEKAIKHFEQADPHGANMAIKKHVKECEHGLQYTKRPTRTTKENAGIEINSPAHDLLPKITADLSSIFFTSHREGFTGKHHPEDIYITHKKDGQWTEPENAGAPVNTEGNDVCVGLSYDGMKMFIFRGVNGGDLFISEVNNGKWTTPEPFPFNTDARESSVCLSPDEREMFFVRKEADRDANIYYSKKNDEGEWDTPEVLSKTINSPYDEETPFLHPDGRTLYFSSKGHTSMGGYDVFRSIRDENGKWSTPGNLGSPVNTAADEIGLVVSADQQTALYSSSGEDSQGGQDVYFLHFHEKEVANANLTLLKGRITDNKTGDPLEATLEITDNENGEQIAKFRSSAASGRYLVSLPAGKNYGITAEKESYLFHSENIYLAKGEGFKEVIKDITLHPAKEESATVVLRNIFFESGSYTLSKTSSAELNRITRFMEKHPEMNIEIAGHTDNVGNDEDNIELSRKRAEAVISYLTAQGIDAGRLTAKGYGSKQPIADNDTSEGRAQNRRITFTTR